LKIPLFDQNKGQNKRQQSRLSRLIEVVFSKGIVLSVSGKSESVNERTNADQQKINKIPHTRGSLKVAMN